MNIKELEIEMQSRCDDVIRIIDRMKTIGCDEFTFVSPNDPKFSTWKTEGMNRSDKEFCFFSMGILLPKDVNYIYVNDGYWDNPSIELSDYELTEKIKIEFSTKILTKHHDVVITHKEIRIGVGNYKEKIKYLQSILLEFKPPIRIKLSKAIEKFHRNLKAWNKQRNKKISNLYDLSI